MARARWRPIRQGHEKEDRAYNEDLAEKLLSDPAVDDTIIAFGLTGWKLVGPDGARWPMAERTVHVPPWAATVAEQDRDARRGAAVVAEIDRHMPRPRPAAKSRLRANRRSISGSLFGGDPLG
jgi:hypothetical protein